MKFQVPFKLSNGMAYDEKLTDRLREALASQKKVVEKRMFSGVAFMVNGKMCINVSHDKLMCRFDPILFDEIYQRPGYEPMVMRGKQLKGYCYVSEEGFRKPKDFEYWVNLCLEFNSKAKAAAETVKKQIKPDSRVSALRKKK